MKKYIPKDKLSKKEKRALNAQQRVRWEFAPASRIIPNKKKDSNHRVRLNERDDSRAFYLQKKFDDPEFDKTA